MATEKMTVVKALTEALTFIPEDHMALIDKLKHMIEQAEKKNNGDRKPSAAKLENDRIRNLILDFLRTSSDPVTIADIKAAVPELNAASSQRVAGLMNPLVSTGLVYKFIEKRMTFYEIVAGE